MTPRPAHVFVCSSLAAALGAYLALAGVAWVFALGLALSLYLLVMGLRLDRRRAALTLVLAFIISYGLGLLRVGGLYPPPDDISQLRTRSGFITFSGQVLSCRGGAPGETNLLEVAPTKLLSPWPRALGGKVLVRLAAPPPEMEETKNASVRPSWGGRYIFSGRILKPSSPVFSFEPDGKRRLALRNIFCQVSCRSSDVEELCQAVHQEQESSPARSFAAAISGVRDSIIAAHCAALGEDRGKLLTSMVLGDRAVSLSQTIKSTFMRVGLSHLLAASGLNLTIIVGAVVFFFGLRRKYLIGKTRVGEPSRSLPQTFAALVCVLFFVSLAGVSPSVTRATIMCLLLLWSTLVFRRLAVGAALAGALWLALFLDPAGILDVGLQLSYGATFGIIYFYPIFKAALPLRCSERPWSWLCSLVVVVMAAQLAVLPVQISCFQKISTLVIPANIMAEPLVAPITVMGFLSSFLSALAAVLHVSVLEKVVTLIDYLCGFFIDLLMLLANSMASSPLAYLYLSRPPVWSVVFYYLLLLWAFVLGAYRPGRAAVMACAAGVLFTALALLLSPVAEILVTKESVVIAGWGQTPVCLQRTTTTTTTTTTTASFPKRESGYLPGYHRDFTRAFLATISERGPARPAILAVGTNFKFSFCGCPLLIVKDRDGGVEVVSLLPALAMEVEEAQGVRFYRYRICSYLWASLIGQCHRP